MAPCEKCKEEGDLTAGLCPVCTEAEVETETFSQGRRATPCPCGDGPSLLKDLMQCGDCTVWFHPYCVGLTGLTQYMTNKLADNGWKCPSCFQLNDTIKKKLGLEVPTKTSGDESLSKTFRDELTSIIPEVVEEIKAGVKQAFRENAVLELVGGAKEAISKTWADVAKTEQKKVMKEVVEQTSEAALQKSLGRISADLSEQKNRSRNCIISQVPEANGEGTTVNEVVANLGDLDVNHIVDAKRLGERKGGQNRLILVRFKREDVAQEFHNFGRGRSLRGGVWANPDLTRTERIARFQMRKERREKRESVRARAVPAQGGDPPVVAAESVNGPAGDARGQLNLG